MVVDRHPNVPKILILQKYLAGLEITTVLCQSVMKEKAVWFCDQVLLECT
jgi:hypothetical protein